MIKTVHRYGYAVREEPEKRMFGYAGMNADAAKKFGWRKLGQRTVEVDRTMTPAQQERTIKHEIIEKTLMDRGRSYRRAHVVALHHEYLSDKAFAQYVKKIRRKN
jgi:hypothetical protein